MIQTYFHVIKDPEPSDGDTTMTYDQVVDSMDVLNAAFAPDFTFVLDPTNADHLEFVDEPPGNGWYSARIGSNGEASMKNELHKGDCSSLNIYASRPDGGLLGWATFPYACNSFDSPSKLDGVVILDSSAPGGSAVNYDEGDTLVHEVGHWLGLYHTFHSGCNGGDDIHDTPAESRPAYGCPVDRDTCPDQAGFDPVTNYMDYTDDSCMDTFTTTQYARMVSNWDTYRAPTSSPTSSPLTSPTVTTSLPTPSPSTSPTVTTSLPTPSPSTSVVATSQPTLSGSDTPLDLIFFNDFETPSNWGNFSNEGNNTLRNIEDHAWSGNAWSGEASLVIYNETYRASSTLTTKTINVPDYAEVVVRFIFKYVSECHFGSFALEYLTSSPAGWDAEWKVKNEWYLHEHFVNDQWEVGMQVIPVDNPLMKFRFISNHCDEMMLFIDDVSVHGKY